MRCVDGQKTILNAVWWSLVKCINLIVTNKKVSWHAPVLSNLMEKCTTLTNSYPVLRGREKFDKSLFISLRSPLHPGDRWNMHAFPFFSVLDLSFSPTFFFKVYCLVYIELIDQSAVFKWSKDNKTIPYLQDDKTNKLLCCWVRQEDHITPKTSCTSSY